MKVYWTLEAIPELAILPSSARLRVWRACVRQSLKHWQTWVSMLLPVASLAPAWALLTFLVRNGMNAPVAILVTLPIAGISAVLGSFLVQQIIIVQTRPYLRTYIEQHYSSLGPSGPEHS